MELRRTIDIEGRAMACAKAMQDAMRALSPDATGDEVHPDMCCFRRFRVAGGRAPQTQSQAVVTGVVSRLRSQLHRTCSNGIDVRVNPGFTD